ncbi:hypothetical protein HMPREF3293_01906 [Christensenella minuta]|uniref:Uncharacterized protein n=1 Tax=Christensenella minuta TaxID=626937 RepID=A0A136Q464_9FIRM|nr:hypothetical protein HMPREF3293_01906 [Christensenella minuta]
MFMGENETVLSWEHHVCAHFLRHGPGKGRLTKKCQDAAKRHLFLV